MKKKAAARGYGYVAISRFTTRRGCHLYGKLRRSDFLPVGEEQEDEVLERGIYSEDSCSDSEGSLTGNQQYMCSSALAGDLSDADDVTARPLEEGQADDFA